MNMSAGNETSAHKVGRFLAFVPLLFLRVLASLAVKPNKGNLHWRQLVALRFLQSQRATLPQDILQWYVRRTSTGEGVRGYCAKHGISHRQVTLESAAVGEHSTSTPPGILHILTPKSSKNEAERTNKTILYLHGGGYVNPMRSEAHMPFIIKIVSASRASQVAILEYSLAPEHPYPAQTIQAIAALNHVLNRMSIPAEEITIAGDSAGGQMVGSVLAHIVRPCPYALPISLPKGAKLGAALMISPLTVLEIKDESYIRNDGQDYLDKKQMGGFEAAWKPANGEVWADMCEGEGSKEVWDEVFRGTEGGVVTRVMVTVGTAEVFLDCCREFAKSFLRAEKTVRVGQGTNLGELDWNKEHLYVECEGEVHVQVALDSAVGYEGGLMMAAILGWLKSF
ncbi:Alpha/Beta hydrolase protein [Rhypophila decipiens]|uniref:Alpha/Beta hydrolase protein n=1 Tax=Rhypophila decipiens TaxID=261697 RepID=A0AAN6YLP6_9PEZI|nr:Alpha/Beta hydrolase protein [Rhypophila decipiens]